MHTYKAILLFPHVLYILVNRMGLELSFGGGGVSDENEKYWPKTGFELIPFVILGASVPTNTLPRKL